MTQLSNAYSTFLAELKRRIRSARLRTVISVNTELILLYWSLGRDIRARQRAEGWGAKVITRLAADLRRAFPDMTGISARNLKYMRLFADTWPDQAIVQQVAAQLPWGHNSFEFLALRPEMLERDLQRGLLDHVRALILELGKGFAFVGSQYPIQVGDQDYFIDLLFYHLRLRCFVVIELKVGGVRLARFEQTNGSCAVSPVRITRSPETRPAHRRRSGAGASVDCRNRTEWPTPEHSRPTNEPAQSLNVATSGENTRFQIRLDHAQMRAEDRL